VAVGAEKPNILGSVVQEVAVDVIDVERQTLPLPRRSDAADGALLGDSDLKHCAAQLPTPSARLAGAGRTTSIRSGWTFVQLTFPLL
jgi:hypothetical protein